MAKFKKTRQHVIGKYVHYNVYVLYNMNGTEFMTIKENKPFYIGKKLYVPIKEKNKGGKGTILRCNEYNRANKVISTFVLPHNKEGLWALTANAAENGVFHIYQSSETPLEKCLAAKGISKKVIERKNTLNETLEVGGPSCNHVSVKKWHTFLTDGKDKDLSAPTFVKKSKIPEHIGCMVSTYNVQITEATYIIYYTNTSARDDKDGSSTIIHINKIYLSKDVNEENVIAQIEDMEY